MWLFADNPVVIGGYVAVFSGHDYCCRHNQTSYTPTFPSMKTSFKLLACAAIFAPAIASAQIANTSGGVWSVTSGLVGSASPSGSSLAQNIGPSIPGQWTDNNPSANWIGINSTGTQSGSPGGDNVHRFRYLFQYTFTSPAPLTEYTFNLGWDNYLMGAYLGGSVDGTASNWLSGATELSLNPDPGSTMFGFCGVAGGISNSMIEPCVYASSLTFAVNAPTTLTFVIEGDGTTDGFYLESTGSNPVSVPEPASLALLAVGFAGLGLSSRRSRRA